ncbi:MAG: YbjQ family protein [Candidatus Dormibacteraeota bacterium]|nr:YbjQ family protein [Candidatus Dormibacteraeota bacterium]
MSYQPEPDTGRKPPPLWVTTGTGFDGYRVVRQLGVVRGLMIRSRSVVGNIGAGFQQFVGGRQTVYMTMSDHARQEAYDLMVEHAAALGANAVIAMRYDSNELSPGVSEILAYGTAVVIVAVDDDTATASPPAPAS